MILWAVIRNDIILIAMATRKEAREVAKEFGATVRKIKVYAA